MPYLEIPYAQQLFGKNLDNYCHIVSDPKNPFIHKWYTSIECTPGREKLNKSRITKHSDRKIMQFQSNANMRFTEEKFAIVVSTMN